MSQAFNKKLSDYKKRAHYIRHLRNELDAKEEAHSRLTQRDFGISNGLTLSVDVLLEFAKVIVEEATRGNK